MEGENIFGKRGDAEHILMTFEMLYFKDEIVFNTILAE